MRYATHLLGAASVYLSAPPDPGKRAQMLVDFRPGLVVVFPETAHLLPPTTAPCAAIGPVEDVLLRLDELASEQDPAPMESRARPSDLAVVVSSGGTTGVPKGSVRDFGSYTPMVAVPSPATRRQLANGKLAYLTQALVDTTLLGGGTVILQSAFHPAATLAAIEAERVTHLFLVEPQLFDLMDHPDVTQRDLSSLSVLTHIGAAAAPVLRMRARERLGPVIAHTYGASEMGLVSALTPPEHDLAHPDRFTCAGRVLPGVEVRFRSPDGALDERAGAIEVRSPAMAAGYLRRPVEQATNFVDGWYRTGDLGRPRRRRLSAHSRPRRGLRRDRRTAGYARPPFRTCCAAGPTSATRSSCSTPTPLPGSPLSFPGLARPSTPPGASTRSPARSARRWHQQWWSCPWTGSAHRAGQAEPPGDPPARPRACR